MSWWNIIKDPTLSTSAGFTPALHNTTYGEKPPCETCEDKETPCGCKIEKRKRSDKRYWNLIDTLMQDGEKRSVNAIIDGLYSNRKTISSRGPLSLKNVPMKNAISTYLRTNKNYIAVTKRSPKEYQWLGEEE